MDTLADKAVSKLRGKGIVPGESKMAGTVEPREPGEWVMGWQLLCHIAHPLRGTVQQEEEVAQDRVFPEGIGDRTGAGIVQELL